MADIPAIQNQRYLQPDEIDALLEGVEYIIKASAIVGGKAHVPLQFTLFLNTSEAIPEAYRGPVLEKFVREHNITAYENVFSDLDTVGFAQTELETPMPMHLITPNDRASIPHTYMHVIDFEGDSPDFDEAKSGLTGWSYAYN